jgi:plasmid replication initiation protein
MFDFKEKYFTYEIWNALKLKGPNQLRMYEILKQYEKAGCRILLISDLKKLLWIGKDEYSRYERFRISVLNACQKALAKHTDITFTYEPYGKRGKGGKVLQLKFAIKKNDAHSDQLSLNDFIDCKKQRINGIIDDNYNELSLYESRMIFLSDACENEFSISEVKVLHDKIIDLLPHDIVKNELECYNYLTRKFRYMNMQNEKKKIKHRFKYMVSIIGKE